MLVIGGQVLDLPVNLRDRHRDHRKRQLAARGPRRQRSLRVSVNYQCPALPVQSTGQEDRTGGLPCAALT